jgi:integrase
MATLIKVGSKWYSDLRMGGRRIKRALHTDKRIAQRMLDEMVALRRAERYAEVPKDVSIDFFRARHKEISKHPNTLYRDELAFRMMRESMPVTQLRQITPELLERLKTKWNQEGKSLSTVTRAIKAIKAAMRVAEGWRYVAAQPWHSVKVREPQGRLLYYSAEERDRLFRVTHGSWRTYAMLMGLAGLRPAEAYHLEWSDLDFDRNTIWIHAKRDWNPKKFKERRVPMDKSLRAYLEAQPERHGFVLGADRPSWSSMDTYFRRLVQKANLKGSAYTLRHTFASLLVMAGVPLKKVGTMMGHSNSKMTDIYAHLSPESLQTGIELMPAVSSTLVPVPAEGGLLQVI